MILFILFFLVPAVIGVYVSFTEWDLFSSPIFIGLDNFKTILFDQDSLYHTQFFNGMKKHAILCSDISTSVYRDSIAISCGIVRKAKDDALFSIGSLLADIVCHLCCNDHLGVSVK